MAKKNKPNARPQEQNAQRNETKPATAPAANKTVAASSTNGANRNRTLVIVLGIIILLILAVVLLALLLTNRNGDGSTTDNTTSSETTSSEGQVDGTNTTSSEEASSETSSSQSSSETTSSQSSTTTSEEANGNENNNGQGNEGSNNTSAPTNYTEVAGAGDSVSYLARRAMYKYFQATGNALHTRGQRLFFEVTLTNASNPVAINAGQSRTFSADTMTSILNQAKSLTPAQLSAWENAAVAANYR